MRPSHKNNSLARNAPHTRKRRPSKKDFAGTSVRKRSHAGKIRYKTLIAANEAIVSMNQRTVMRFGDMNAYWCAFCQQFHIGHNVNTEVR